MQNTSKPLWRNYNWSNSLFPFKYKVKQLFDEGVIYNLEMSFSTLEFVENKHEINISFLDGINEITKLWDDVKGKINSNCFEKDGFGQNFMCENEYSSFLFCFRDQVNDDTNQWRLWNLWTWKWCLDPLKQYTGN